MSIGIPHSSVSVCGADEIISGSVTGSLFSHQAELSVSSTAPDSSYQRLLYRLLSAHI